LGSEDCLCALLFGTKHGWDRFGLGVEILAGWILYVCVCGDGEWSVYFVLSAVVERVEVDLTELLFIAVKEKRLEFCPKVL
jgi:hypothetical protein